MYTGGGTGIGRAICHVLAREGASVAVAGNELTYVEETVASLKEVLQFPMYIFFFFFVHIQ